MMEIAPVIHSRTYKCDFNTNLIVHPVGFDSSWARQKIQIATASITSAAPGTVRWLIAKEGNRIIVGVVCFIKDLAKLSELSTEEMAVADMYFRDDKKRSIFAFIGFSIRNRQERDELYFEYKDFWNIFVDNMKSIWNQVLPNPIEKVYEAYEKKISSSKIEIPQPTKVDTLTVYQSDRVMDKAIFEYYLNHEESNFQLYTNMDWRYITKNLKGSNSIISTDENTIKRLLSMPKPSRNVRTATNCGTMDGYDEDTAKKKDTPDNQSQNKPFWMNWKFGLGIIILILILLYLVKA